MSKIRVYELAQKMGIDNKELMARLHAIGVEVKSHSSVVDEADAKKLTAPPPVKDDAKDEVRVTKSVIRRRPKHVEPPVEEPAATVEAVAPLEEVVKAAEAPLPKVEEALPPKEPQAKSEVAEAVPVAATVAKDAVKAAPIAGQAKILGRMDLPTMQTKERPTERREPYKPSPRGGGERPVTPRPAERPAAGRPGERPGERPAPPRGVERVTPPAPVEAPVGVEDRKKGRKVKEIPAPVETGKPGKKGAPGTKKKELFKKAELAEKRERVFEPGLRPGKGKKKEKYRAPEGKRTEITVPKAIKRIIKISETITVGELAKRMGTKANDLIRALMKMGMMVTINHPLDVDTATLLATDFGYEIENVAIDLDLMLEASPDTPESLVKRPPVVTIMGHVDHGKTSLLDAIRETNVIAGEAGGITQHIGAYDVELNGRKITFLDTPGHEAFTAMRARGAKVTDIVILVVAADDGVMPQTREAVNHSKAAGVPIIVAINKIDKPDAKPERVRTELLQHEVQVETMGGETLEVEVSAKQKLNLDKLLEAIALQAEVLDLKANPNRSAEGTVIEARLDKGRGPVATVLVQRGTLSVGDLVVAGAQWGRVRALLDDKGETRQDAGPSFPVEVLGFSGTPEAGDRVAVVESEARAREITEYRERQKRDQAAARGGSARSSLSDMMSQLKTAGRKEFPLVIKGDVQGSVEAIVAALEKLGTDEVAARVVHAGVGGITESDITLAQASGAAVIGFNVRAHKEAREESERLGIEIRYYNIIYNLVDDVKAAMSGLLSPTLRETMLGNALILEVFDISKVGKVAGCRITDGKVERGANVRLIRDNVVVHEGKLSTLKRFKDEVKEVDAGQECGMAFENYQDMRQGDVIECYRVEEIKRTL